MKLINGNIPEGKTCDYSDECNFKEKACNSNGCPVCDGKTIDIPFSCGAARFLNMINNTKKEK